MRKEVRQAGIPALHEVGAEPGLGRLFDLLLHRDHAAAGEMLAAIFECGRKTGGGQPFRKAPIGKILGVDQNPVAVEDDQLWKGSSFSHIEAILSVEIRARPRPSAQAVLVARPSPKGEGFGSNSPGRMVQYD
ncbi:hypothetical protein LB553_05915 [Mesorhizobium sp. CA8]|nr:hypothetical protein [Mesorhizobium sp. CA8]MBZ9760411.1 hypothetical protein [Mesorhizobium sp. CA8]